MTSPDNEQRRRSPRLPINLRYQLTIDDMTYAGDIRNISLSGTYLASIKPELPATSIAHQGQLSIHSNNEWITINCVIVYISDRTTDFPEGVGVKFCQDNEETISDVWNIAIQYLL